jgi:hypothetical protein
MRDPRDKGMDVSIHTCNHAQSQAHPLFTPNHINYFGFKIHKKILEKELRSSSHIIKDPMANIIF